MFIGSTIKRTRLARGMSQVDLEHASGLSGGSISRIERDEQSYTNETISQIANALAVPVHMLFSEGGENEQELPLTRQQKEWLSVLDGLTMSQAAKFMTEIEAQRQANDQILRELASGFLTQKAR